LLGCDSADSSDNDAGTSPGVETSSSEATEPTTDTATPDNAVTTEETTAYGPPNRDTDTDAVTTADETVDDSEPEATTSGAETSSQEIETTDEATSSEPGTTTDEGATAETSDAPMSGDASTDSTTEPAPALNGCDDPSLTWHSANKTNYESYPDPGSEECIEFNGCEWEGQFAGCDDKRPEAWVAAHNIVAAFPDFDDLALHDLCLRRGESSIVVTVLDTCGDSDCDGCCSENQGDSEQLIDLEKYTNERWGEPDGPIEWADLGPNQGDGCE
jgi:hypothetical protein